MPLWFAPDHLARTRSLCVRVKRRTGMEAWIDTARAEVCFGFIAPDGDVRLPMSCRLFRDLYRRVPSKFDPVLDQWSEDDIVYALQLAKVDPKRKAAWAQAVETSRKSDERAEMEKHAGDYFAPALRETERRYERHAMGRHYRPRVAVNGLRST